MSVYAITIKPGSPFGTPLKGDTLFGQFCWQAAERPDILKGGLSHWMDCYGERPFAVFSSAWPKIQKNGCSYYAIRRPELPLSLLGDPDQNIDCENRLKNLKKNKGRKWLLLKEDLRVQLEWDMMIDDKDLYDLHHTALPEDWQRRLRLIQSHHRRPSCNAEQQHNSINRLTMTTGKGEFAPYSTLNTCFLPELEFVIFAYIDDEACTAERLHESLSGIGQWGFGRDASTGLGRFKLIAVENLTIPQDAAADACLTLGPCVPDSNSYQEMFFSPFIRFGRHGAQLLHTGKPFKNPVVMADDGAVFVTGPGNLPQQPYLGRAVNNISKAQPEAVCQGYSLFLPMQMPALS